MTFDADIANAAPEPLFVVQDERVVWANRAAEELLGADPGGLTDRPLAALLATGGPERLARLGEQRLEGWPLPDNCWINLLHLDGRVIPADLRSAPFDHGVVLAVRSAQGRVRAEALLERLTRLSTMDSAVANPMALLDASASVFRELGWTLAFAEVFENASITREVITEPGDPIGEYAESIKGLRLPFSETPILAEVARQRRPMYLDQVPTDVSGPVKRAANLSVAMTRARVTRSAWLPVFYADRVTHLIAVAGRDLGEHDFIALQIFAQQIAAAFRSAELRAEIVRRERLAALGEMAAVLAHEVRNPLAVIFNALSCIRHDAPESGLVHDALEAATEEAERLRRLMADLLDFARPPNPRLCPLSLASEIKDAVHAVQQAPMSQRVTTNVRVELPEDLPAVDADTALLRRTLVNVLENAFQHAAPKSEIEVSAAPEDQLVHLCIDNRGTRLNPEVARRAFEPFFTTRPTGTGLGLAVVRQAMESMGGSAQLEATAAGARITLTLRASRI